MAENPTCKRRVVYDPICSLKPGSHVSINISIRTKQKTKHRNEVKPAT